MRPILVAFVALLAVGSSWAADVLVSVGGTGDCINTPCGDIASAYAAAASGDNILLAAGTYTGTGNSAISFTGSKVVRIAPAAVGVRPVIDLAAATDKFITNNATSVTIEGLTIANGVTFGAIGLTGSSLPSSTQITFKNVIFQNNKVAVHSAWDAGDINFDTCSFVGNTGDMGAAIVSTISTRIIVSNSTFTGNNATVAGAAILTNVAFAGSAIFVSDSTFTNNRAIDGAAIYAASDNSFSPLGDIRITRSRFTRNVALQSGGAGLIATTARTSFTDCIFEQNQAASGGALSLPLASNLENALFQRCQFNMNMATGTGNRASGGALFAANPVDIRNSQFNANTAALSGGAVFAQAEIFLSDSSLSSNVAAQSGGAMYFDSASVPHLERNVFDRNNATAGHGGAVYSAAVRFNTINNDFDTNRALAGSGAAIYNEVGTLGISAGDFTNNMALAGVAAVYSAGVTTVTGDATFVGNKASSAGALACVSATSGSAAFSLTLTDVTFDGNVAETGNGGAVDAGRCTTTVTNGKFMNNDAAGHGGSIVISDALSLRVTGSQFTNNVADGAGAGIYADSIQSIFLNTVTSSGNVAARPGAVLTVNASTNVLELRGLSGSANLPSDVFVDPSAGSSLAVNLIDSTAPGAIEVSAGSVTITSASRVMLAGLHLFGNTSLTTNTDLNVTASFKWGNGSISGSRPGLTLTVDTTAAASLERASLSHSSSRSLVGVSLLNYGNMTVGYVADSNGSYPLSAPKEVPCLNILGSANFTTFNSSRTTLGYNCLITAPAGSISRLNVSGIFHIDGSVVLNNIALTIFNRSMALTTFHIRNLKSGEDDIDNILIRGRNDSYLGGQLAVLNQGSQFRPEPTFVYTVSLIRAMNVFGNFSRLNVNVSVTLNTTSDGQQVLVPSDKPYGVIRHNLTETTLIIDEKNRPDPNSGQVAVIIVSVILALIGAGVLALYIRSIVKCFLKKGKGDEDDEDSDSDSDEEKPLTKGNADAAAREKAEMDRIDAEAAAGKKGKKSTNEVELNEVADDDAPARKKNRDRKKKEKEPEPEPESDVSSEEVKPARKAEKKTEKKAEKKAEKKPEEEPKSEKKPAKKPAKKAESSEEESSDSESESEEKKPIAKTKSASKAPKKKVETSSDSSEESS